MNNITSPCTDDHGIEQLIQAKGKTAPRVTPQDLLNVIDSEHFFTAYQGAIMSFWAASPEIADEVSDEDAEALLDAYGVNEPNRDALSLLTFCVLVLKNGFTVTGESACASPENFDAEIGKKIAYENAKQKIWPLMGYALKQELHKGAQ
jgi:Phage protein (N4 Gp49/phage Sf6 gene 66) family